MASIERLPPELLQPIFSLSGFNLAFPGSSPRIASKLSEDYVYQLTCRHYFTSNLESRLEQSRAQTKILTYKWMTWEFFQSFVVRTYKDGGCLCGGSDCKTPIWPPNFEDPTAMNFIQSHFPALWYIKCRLPTGKLLRGPWTQDKIHFLQFLLCTTGVTIDKGDKDTMKYVLEGKKEAIRTGDLDAVHLFNSIRRLGKAPGMDLIRYAVVECGCDRSIVYDTMAAARLWGLRGDKWECDVLDAWCDNAIQAGDPKGKWLQLKLKELRTMDGPRHGSMNPRTGDYDDVDGDKLVLKEGTTNQKGLRPTRGGLIRYASPGT